MNDKATILIVDSDETSSLLLKEALLLVLPDNYKILSMADGREAIDLCGREKPIGVFTEIRLKNMDGFWLTRHIKEFDPGIPVVIQTATPKDYVEQQVCECGCDGYLTKPLELSKLRNLLETIFHTC